MSVVGRERDGEDIGRVSNEAAGGRAGVEVPKSESFVPRCGESELTVGGDDDVRDEVVVTVQDLFRETNLVGVATPGQLPDNNCLVYGEIAQICFPFERCVFTYHETR